MSTLLDHFPAVHNLQTRTQALGMAVQGYSVHYLSTAGPGTACKSIWSSLVSPRGTLDCQPWGYNRSGRCYVQVDQRGIGGGTAIAVIGDDQIIGTDGIYQRIHGGVAGNNIAAVGSRPDVLEIRSARGATAIEVQVIDYAGEGGIWPGICDRRGIVCYHGNGIRGGTAIIYIGNEYYIVAGLIDRRV